MNWFTILVIIFFLWLVIDSILFGIELEKIKTRLDKLEKIIK